MKINVVLCAALFALGLTACEQPAEQDEPEQPEPDTEATMERAPDQTTPPGQLETVPERDVETTTSETGTTGETGEETDTEAEEPPPK